MTWMVLGDLAGVNGNNKVDDAATSSVIAVAPMGGKKNGGEGMMEEAKEL